MMQGTVHKRRQQFRRRGRGQNSLQISRRIEVKMDRNGKGGGALCVEMGFAWTFPKNQDATVKLKSEFIFIKF